MDLAQGLGFTGVRHTRQVHGKAIHSHGEPGFGLSVGADGDGHITSAPGTLLAVTVADCVPVFLVDPDRRTVALLHAGWRGTAAGILEEGISLLLRHSRGNEGDILMHLGPAICGTCYEVGGEVHAALGLPPPEKPSPVDLRGVLTERAIGLGLLESH
ncbi:MAG: laccase domain-containing protein, partial [Longimicrobiales bacterium]